MEFKSLDSLPRSELSEPTESDLELTETESIEKFQPAKPPRRIPKRLVGGLALLLVIGGGYLAYRQWFGPQPIRMAVVPIERKTFSVTISANGTIEPEKVINVSPKNQGILKRLLVDEGDYVTQGQAIAYMDDSNLRGQLVQEQGKLAQAEANLRKLIAGNRIQDIDQAQARLATAQAALKIAEDDYRRNRALKDAGAISQLALNQKLAERDKAQGEVAAAQQALSLQRAGTRQEEIDQARAEVTFARGSLQTVQTLIDDTVIRAAFSGIVLRKYADPGAFVTPMTAGSSVTSATSSSVLSLASSNQAVANVSESNISKIRLGQPVVIEADAYPGETFQGKVAEISTQALVQQNVTSFLVKSTILSDTRAGMNISVDFKVGQLQNVLTVPTIAVTRQNEATGVYVLGPDQRPRFIPVTTGSTVDNRTEIKSGLNGQEQVLMSLPPRPKAPSFFSFPNLFGGSNDGPPGGGPPGGPGGPPGGPPGGAPPGGP
jgi:HlyD family secretion protein